MKSSTFVLENIEFKSEAYLSIRESGAFLQQKTRGNILEAGFFEQKIKRKESFEWVVTFFFFQGLRIYKYFSAEIEILQ